MQRPEEAGSAPAVRWRAEGTRALVMRTSQPAAELVCGVAVGPSGFEPFQRQTGVVVSDDTGTRHPALG